MKQSNTLLEVCCGSTDDVIEAYKAGADRVELNSDLFHGGLTPTVGALAVAKRETDFPIMTMIRPREGGFCYTELEYRTCLEDARILLDYGADGLVFGFLTPESVFHRAFDVVPDWKEAIDMLADLKITRILTSGQAPSVSDATDTIKEMIDYAGNRIQILPGAGITLRNVQRIVHETGANQIHVAIHRVLSDTSTRNNRSIYYGGCLYPAEDSFSMIDRNAIGSLKTVL